MLNMILKDFNQYQVSISYNCKDISFSVLIDGKETFQWRALYYIKKEESGHTSRVEKTELSEETTKALRKFCEMMLL